MLGAPPKECPKCKADWTVFNSVTYHVDRCLDITTEYECNACGHMEPRSLAEKIIFMEKPKV